MGQYFSRQYVHFIIAVKRREKLIRPEIEAGLYGVVRELLLSEKSEALCIGGCEEHIHVLADVNHRIALSALMRGVKEAATRWMNSNMPKGVEFSWQSGWAAFSVSQSNLLKVRTYIEGQKSFHRKTTFRDELVEFLVKHGIEFDERYIF